jgi:hypothetical protein
LQFLVLKIALRDQTLLTQKGHPARMLINRVGSISLGLKQIDPTGAHITQEICRIVETLLEDDSENSQLFIRMLDEFDAFIARELRSSEQTIAHTVKPSKPRRTALCGWCISRRSYARSCKNCRLIPICVIF